MQSRRKGPADGKTARPLLFYFARRLWRRSRPEPRKSARRWRRFAARMGDSQPARSRRCPERKAARPASMTTFVARGFAGIGAWILGRNMFGPIRGDWPDDSWKGWWGKNPPYHGPVFVLTHHPRAPIAMEGGTIFHFVTDGIHAALKRATDAANGLDVRLGGGVVDDPAISSGGPDRRDCMLRLRRFCWAAARIFLPGSIFRSSATRAANTSLHRMPRTSFSRNAGSCSLKPKARCDLTGASCPSRCIFIRFLPSVTRR